MYDALVVGAGLTGIILARRLAEEKGQKVLIVEKRNHIGGDCYDYRDANGILIHKYGPHIFRTEDEEVFAYLSRFTKWTDYQHKVLCYVGGHFYPMPINLDTINRFIGASFTTEDVTEYFEHVRVKKDTIENVRDVIETQVGSEFYHAFFETYTTKQWGVTPENLPPEIVARIPIRTNRDDRYFTLKYQAIPTNGYTAMMQSMLDHENISVLLGQDYLEIRDEFCGKPLYFTGSIDSYFAYQYGALPYRCVSFKLEEYDREQYQPVAVVNYPNDYDYTRITEFKHFLKNSTAKTVIAKEFSSAQGNPSYPIPTAENVALYQKYAALAGKTNTIFAGRLGRYQYYSMDQIVKSALQTKLG